MKQRRADMLFQEPDLLADGAGGDEQLFGGLAEAQLARGGLKDPKCDQGGQTVGSHR